MELRDWGLVWFMNWWLEVERKVTNLMSAKMLNMAFFTLPVSDIGLSKGRWDVKRLFCVSKFFFLSSLFVAGLSMLLPVCLNSVYTFSYL